MAWDNVYAITGRSTQGRTRPFFCKLEKRECDAYVKGNHAGITSCVKEWVCYRLGRILGLPIPEACIAFVPSTVVEQTIREDLDELRAGEWFASTVVPQATELLYTQINDVPSELRELVLFFDIWVMNGDRQLGENGGNANFLHTYNLMSAECNYHVIDHNLAFDETESLEQLKKHHIFKNEISQICSIEFRSKIEPLLTEAFEALEDIWNEMPDEWIENSLIKYEEICTLMGRFKDERFWRFES